MKKEIIIKLPKDAEDILVYKELSLDNGDSILITVRENTFGEDATEEQSEPKVFFCYQDRVRGGSGDRYLIRSVFSIVYRWFKYLSPDPHNTLLTFKCQF